MEREQPAGVDAELLVGDELRCARTGSRPRTDAGTGSCTRTCAIAGSCPRAGPCTRAFLQRAGVGPEQGVLVGRPRHAQRQSLRRHQFGLAVEREQPAGVDAQLLEPRQLLTGAR
jgi:hypothetical protein